MHEKKMWDWEEWNDSAKTTVDLSHERNDLGLIPLSCPKRLSSTGRKCTTKLFDGPRKRRQNGVAYRNVQCLLCGWQGFRKIGLKRE